MKEISIVLSGEAGKGIKTIEEAVTNVLATEGYSVYSFKEIMSRIRGGNNTTQIRVADTGTFLGTYSDKTDYWRLRSTQYCWRRRNHECCYTEGLKKKKNRHGYVSCTYEERN